MTTLFKNKFEHSLLTKIHRKLIFAAFKMIKDEIKANITSIHLEIIGRVPGHLGLIFHPMEYVLVTVIPYVCHLNHPPLVIPPGTTNHEATCHCEEHKKAK